MKKQVLSVAEGLIPIVLICSILCACSMHVEKRKYLKGYYISFSHNRGQARKPDSKIITPVPRAGTNSIPVLPISVQTNNLSQTDYKIAELKKHQINSQKNNSAVQGDATRNNKNQFVSDRPAVSQNQPYTHTYVSQSELSQTKSKKSASDGLFIFLSGAFVAAFTMAFKPFISHTKKIGYWALNNRKLARGLHFVSHSALASCGLFLGHRICDAGLVSSDVTTYSLAGAATVLTAVYPHRKSKTGFFKNTYFKQKMFSLLMVLTGFLMCINIGNRHAADNLSFPLVKNVWNISTDTNEHDSITTLNKQTPKDNNTEVKVVLTVLASIVGFLLCIVIVGGSCSLSCSGQGTLAIGTLVIGLPLTIILTNFIIKNIWGIKKKKVKAAENTPT